MPMLTTTLTITQAEMFDLCRGQVEPGQREALRAEIERRWPDGLRLPIHLAAAPESTD